MKDSSETAIALARIESKKQAELAKLAVERERIRASVHLTPITVHTFEPEVTTTSTTKAPLLLGLPVKQERFAAWHEYIDKDQQTTGTADFVSGRNVSSFVSNSAA